MKAPNDVKQRYAHDTAHYNPPTPYLKNWLLAFIVGGLICTVGQFGHELFVRQGLDDVEAGARMAVVIVVIGAFLTGLGIYDKLGKFAGAGSAIPISGFSNSMTSAAMEFSRDGWVNGLGTNMFSVSGPVIVSGILSALVFTAIRALIMLSG